MSIARNLWLFAPLFLLAAPAAHAQEGRGPAPRIDAQGTYNPRYGGKLEVITNAQVVDGLFFSWDPETKTATWRRVAATDGHVISANVVSWQSPLTHAERQELEQSHGIKLKPYDLLEVHPSDGEPIYTSQFGNQRRRAATGDVKKPERTVDLGDGKTRTHNAVTIMSRLFVFAPENLQTGVKGHPTALPVYPKDRYAVERLPKRNSVNQPGKWEAQYQTQTWKEHTGYSDWYKTTKRQQVLVLGQGVYNVDVPMLQSDPTYTTRSRQIRVQDKWVPLPWPDLGDLWVNKAPQPAGSAYNTYQQPQRYYQQPQQRYYYQQPQQPQRRGLFGRR